MMHRGIETPSEMLARPVDYRGFPVPWFVSKGPDGEWDWINIRGEKFASALTHETCWVSGVPLGKFRSFVIGPMCVINRVAGDPPVKKNIAEWSAKICPFLSRPLAKRGEPATQETQRGLMIERNPGICAIYTVRRGDYSVMRDGLIRLGDPSDIQWWCHGRNATRLEVVEAIREGMNFLLDIASAEGDHAVKELHRYVDKASKLVPEA